MVTVTNLTKRYGAHVAVDGISFHVGKGEVVGFLGPNGAGKTTTLRILAGSLGMTSGAARVADHDVLLDSFEARKSIGYMPEAVPLYPEMRVVEYLAFRAELKRVARSTRRAFVDDAMEKANVTGVATQLIGTLSKGYRQRVGLADALVAKPPLLILDEPTAGLDPNQIREVRAVIRDLAAEHTVLLSTHILSEVEASCSRVLLIAKGKLVAEGTTDEIRSMRRAIGIDLFVRGDAERAREVLAALALVGSVTAIDTASRAEGASDIATLRCTWKENTTLEDAALGAEDAVAALVLAGVRVREVKPAGGSLEDVFAELTRPSEQREKRDQRETR
jgi:ABC-2 type transport system ATP-binding protein